MFIILLCVVSFLLRACRLNFAEITYTTQNAEQAYCVLLIYTNKCTDSM
jgi:hypothetical protein